MNIIKSGSTFDVFGKDIETFHTLPTGTYDVCFQKMKGFFLQSRLPLEVKEKKIYGSHESRATKILNSFNHANRNFGVILTGEKGIGKSLCARILANKAINNNIPVLVVSSYAPDLVPFLESINQEVMVLFDEFEKTFDKEEQVELLSLFDGINSGKKLFIITCNSLTKINSFYINRPGRFHYLFKFTNPSLDEIRDYFNDNLNDNADVDMDFLTLYSFCFKLSFDALRSIVTELNYGYGLEETLEDLNIEKSRIYSTLGITFKDGKTFYSDPRAFNMDDLRCWINSDAGDNSLGIFFKRDSVKNHIHLDFNELKGYIDLECLEYELDEDFPMTLSQEKQDTIIEKRSSSNIEKVFIDFSPSIINKSQNTQESNYNVKKVFSFC